MEKDLGEIISIQTVNRDGDIAYIECPKCSELNLERITLFRCKDCGTLFSVYEEDGYGYIPLLNQDINLKSTGATLKIEKNGDYFYKISEDKCDKRLLKDLWNGKDAHGHEPYRVYNLEEI